MMFLGADGRPEEEPLQSSLQGLAEILLSEEGVDDLLGSVTSLAADAVPGCDAASVSLVRDGRPTTPVCSAEIARQVDHTQYESGEGPCLAAMATRSVIRVDSFATEGRWPDFTLVAASKGIVSCLSLPLHAGHDVVGALNLYSRRARNFAGVEDRALVFARQAAVTLANAQALDRARELARHLAVALENRDVIGQAKGIIMASDRMSSDEAFEVLRRASQRSNRKLHEIARDIVARRRPDPDLSA